MGVKRGVALPAVAVLVLVFAAACAGHWTRRPDGPPKHEAAYSEVDEYALAAPPAVEGSPETLAGYLCGPWTSEADKARALYRWITERIDYRLEAAPPAAQRETTPAAVLQSRRAVCEGFADLFVSLARASGLEAETIPGFAKGVGYEAGDSFAGRLPDHAWNAVKIGGTWRLLDCTWGAGALDQDGRYRKRFEPYYFCTPPEEFLMAHLPTDPKWQLVERPISLEEFERLPYVKAAFSEFGLSLLSHKTSVIDTDEPAVSVRLGSPPDVLLEGGLWKEGRRLARSLVEVHRSRASQEILVRLPSPGTYILRVFAAREGQRAGNFRTYEWAMDYKIVRSGRLSKRGLTPPAS